MDRVGSSYDCKDGVITESLWQGLMREAVHMKLFLTMSQARLELFE